MRWEPFRIILIVATLSCLVILVHVRQPQARTRQLLGLGYLFGLRTCLDTLTFDLILVKLDQKQEFLIHEKLCTPL